MKSRKEHIEVRLLCHDIQEKEKNLLKEQLQGIDVQLQILGPLDDSPNYSQNQPHPIISFGNSVIDKCVIKPYNAVVQGAAGVIGELMIAN